MIFGTQSTEERYEDVMKELNEKLDGWCPKQTNAFELYVKSGSEWSKINPSELTNKQNFTDDWVNMPKEAIEYLKTLPEFDAALFKEITGLDVKDESLSGEEVTVEIKGKKYVAVIK